MCRMRETRRRVRRFEKLERLSVSADVIGRRRESCTEIAVTGTPICVKAVLQEGSSGKDDLKRRGGRKR